MATSVIATAMAEDHRRTVMDAITKKFLEFFMEREEMFLRNPEALFELAYKEIIEKEKSNTN